MIIVVCLLVTLATTYHVFYYNGQGKRCDNGLKIKKYPVPTDELALSLVTFPTNPIYNVSREWIIEAQILH